MALGDIITAPIANLRIDGGGANDGRFPDIEYIAENTMALAWYIGGVGATRNYLRTVDISNAGAITLLSLQAMRTLPAAATYGVPLIFPITGDGFGVISHQVAAPIGYSRIDLAQISDDGLTLNYLNGPTGYQLFNNILPASGMGQRVVPLASPGNFASFFTHGDDSGRIQTFNVSGLTITNLAPVPFIFQVIPTDCFDIHATHISGNVYAVVYRTLAGLGTLKTISISADGLTFAVLQTLVFEATGQGQQPHILLHTGNVYVIAHRGPGGTGWITTVRISDDGLTLTLIDALDTGVAGFVNNAFLRISDQPMFVLFSIGVVTTVEVSADGTTTLAVHATNAWGGGGSPVDFRRAARLPDTNIYAMVETRGVGDEGWLSTFEIASVSIPTVTTDLATSVESAAATSNGTLDDDAGEACDCGFEWGETDAYGNTTPTQSKVTGETFSQVISGLDPGQTYHFRAFATSWDRTSYGADRTFTTLAAAPTVTTDPASALSAIAATINGTLDEDGSLACVCGFEWGLDTGYGTTTPTESKTTGETFSQVIGGLSPGTTYHFRAIATNALGTSNGADRSFATAQVISKAYALARREL